MVCKKKKKSASQEARVDLYRQIEHNRVHTLVSQEQEALGISLPTTGQMKNQKYHLVIYSMSVHSDFSHQKA